jgi:transcriptional regulator with PAS, ATPase and Fis domain
MNTSVLWFSANMQWLRRLESAEIQFDGHTHVDRFLRDLRLDSFDTVVVQLPVGAGELARIASVWCESTANRPIILFDPAETVAIGAFPDGAKHEWLLLRNSAPSVIRKAILDAAIPRETQEPWRQMIVGVSPAMAEVRELVGLVGKSNATVLIVGKTGTGKEVAARAIHLASARAARPFVAINCAALPASLLEAELFGHTKGAFTGANGSRVGLFERANGGTILLDEIGEMPLELQAKLLRVLQQKEVLPLGSSDPVSIDVRILAATNADLRALCAAGQFRQDLFYRLNVVPLQMPELCDRPEDVAPLLRHFAARFAALEGQPAKEISAAAYQALSNYSWPGNARELEHSLERAIVVSGDRQLLLPSDFALSGLTSAPQRTHADLNLEIPDSGFSFDRAVHEFQLAIIDLAMRKAGGNRQQAANILGMKRTTLIYKHKALEQSA